MTKTKDSTLADVIGFQVAGVNGFHIGDYNAVEDAYNSLKAISKYADAKIVRKRAEVSMQILADVVNADSNAEYLADAEAEARFEEDRKSVRFQQFGIVD